MNTSGEQFETLREVLVSEVGKSEKALSKKITDVWKRLQKECVHLRMIAVRRDNERDSRLCLECGLMEDGHIRGFTFLEAGADRISYVILPRYLEYVEALSSPTKFFAKISAIGTD